jgi:predicted acetyltransferase
MSLPYSGEGWIDKVAVKATHRNRGIARALLLHSFREAWHRGERVSGLSTDSRTGALTLYEKVGMTVRRSYTSYAKDL